MPRPALAAACALLIAFPAAAAPDAAVLGAAQTQERPFLATLESLVNIESGSDDREGLDRISELVRARLAALGADVRFVETPREQWVASERTAERPGRMVVATFTGRGTKKILLLAHLDTVYPRGSLRRQPFRVEGNKVYGLGISDDKQAVAAILHGMALLRAAGFDEYGTITVLMNGDEETGSPTSRKLIESLGASHDASLSFEASGYTDDKVSAATSGLATVELSVHGKASHAGGSPELGVNALYELAHQVLQMRDLSDPARGTKLNWTVAKAGTVKNAIPDEALAYADVRVLRTDDYARVEAAVRERVKTQLIPAARVEYRFVVGRPPLMPTPAAIALARHAQSIYRDELGLALRVAEVASGGGTDAAYAGAAGHGAVLEHFGLRGAGAHSSRDEYVALDNIVPRLYLIARTLIDISRDKVH